MISCRLLNVVVVSMRIIPPLGLCAKAVIERSISAASRTPSGLNSTPSAGATLCIAAIRPMALGLDGSRSVSLDGRLFAIDKATGEKVWERKIANPDIGETLTLAPLVVRDVAIVGTAGGEFGIRGFHRGHRPQY